MKKIKYLDGLRGLAAFGVVFHHFILAFYPALYSGPGNVTHLKAGWETFASGSIINLFYNGNFFVCVFFVLSGFVLSYKFFLMKDREILTASAVKRYFRLAIPVAFSVFCIYLLMKFSLFYNQPAGDISGSVWLAGFWNFTPNFWGALNETFLGAFFSDTLAYNATLWTIAFEFFGSFLVLGFLALFGKMKNRHWAYLIAIIFFFQTYYLAFILGMLLSDLMAHENILLQKFDRNKLLRTGLLLAGLFLGSYPAGREVSGTIYAFMFNTFFVNPPIVYHNLGAFLVILVMLYSLRLQKIFSLRPLVFLGEISYAIYLSHFFILGSLASFVFLILVSHVPYTAAVITAFLLSLVLILPFSYWITMHVDKKSVQLSRLVYERLFKQE
jgi:peptidoglycan/LPS O-acetylase OafA/YrhL